MTVKSIKDVQIGGVLASIEGYATDPYFEHVQTHVHQLSPLYRVASAVCPANGVILDIGANIGLSGVLMSYIVPDGTVICVEPSAKNFTLLERNLKANVKGTPLPIHCALGASDGVVQFHESGLCGAWNHVSSRGHLGASDANTSVQMTTVDSLMANRDRLDFVKIDVEGFEAEVLKGMGRTIERFAPVVHMEINSITTILEADQSPRDLLRQFTELMGNVYAYGDNDRLVPLDTDDAQRLFLFKNLTEHGCIDDVVGCRDASRLALLA